MVFARIAAIGAVVVLGARSPSQTARTGPARSKSAPTTRDSEGMPDSITLTGVVRDFRADHPDFQRQPRNAAGNGSFGHYRGIVSDEIGEDGKPMFASKGRKVLSQWRSADGARVMPGHENRPEIASLPADVPGSAEAAGNAIESAATFKQWFRDVSGVNLSRAVTLRLERQPGTSKYVFDDRTDPFYRELGGFFPVNGQLYGNYQQDTNFHFTYEIDTRFTYAAGEGQFFLFDGDDDVWVYIDGKLVIDLGGIHSRIDQRVELDRLTWLRDGETYDLKFFFAERHTTQSNFRIETDLTLRTVAMPASSAIYD